MNDSNKVNIIREQGEFFDVVPLKDDEEKLLKDQIKVNESIVKVSEDSNDHK